MICDIRLLFEPFNPMSEIDNLASSAPDSGGVASFVGKVRAGGGVEALELSHYEPLTLPNMRELADQSATRFDLAALLILHRIGHLRPGEPIVCVGAASRHRRDALLAVDFCMDHLKSAAWFWKRELRHGNWLWIEPRDEDHRDLGRWTER